MKRIYAYITATILCIAFVVGEHFYSLAMEDVAPTDSYESQRYLDTPEIESQENTDGEPGDDVEGPSNTYNLTIVNKQNDNQSLTYTYQLSIEGVSGAYRYVVDDTEKYLIFDAQGKTSITINSNETAIIYELPEGTSYYIEQTGGSSGYTVTANNIVSKKNNGILNKNTTITFNNSVPTKDPNSNKNPNTADTHTLGFVIFTIALIIFIAIRYIKIKRYE